MANEEWCWTTDQEHYKPAESRDEAIREATQQALDTGCSHAWIARTRWFTHDELVEGAGAAILERLQEAAYGEVGEHGEDYPHAPHNFEERVEQLIVRLLEENGPPRFFQAVDDELIEVEERPMPAERFVPPKDA